MKKLFTILAAILLTATVWSQTPQKMSYQAVIRNSSNELVINTQIGMQISILQGSVNGTVVYTETQTPTTNTNGLVSVEIGSGAEFGAIDWANDIYFIKIETDPNGGANYTITGTNQLLSVPYAFHAKTAESVSEEVIETDPVFNAWDKDYNDLTNTPTIPTIPENVGEFINDAGYLTEYTETQTIADVAVLGNSVNIQLKNITDPTEAQDAATKAYVDLLEARIEALELAEIQPTDIDGNIYEIVIIGTQIWMAENLKVTHYPNGDPIPQITDNTAWSNLESNNTDDAYSYYNNNVSNEADTYGALYTYAAAIADDWARDNTNGQGVCPDG